MQEKCSPEANDCKMSPGEHGPGPPSQAPVGCQCSEIPVHFSEMPVVLWKKSGKLRAHTGLATGLPRPLSPKILANFTTKLRHFLIPGTNFLKYKVM